MSKIGRDSAKTKKVLISNKMKTDDHVSKEMRDVVNNLKHKYGYRKVPSQNPSILRPPTRSNSPVIKRQEEVK